MWAAAGLAAVLGLGVYALGNEGAFAITQRTDPSMNSLLRNRSIGGAVTLLGGIALAALGGGPIAAILGAGIAAGGFSVLAGTQATLALGSVLDKAPGGAQPTVKGLYRSNGGQEFAGVFNAAGGGQRFGRQHQRPMAGIVNVNGQQQFAGLGAFDDDSAPWASY